MPQVDLETLVSACAGGGNDRKIACETLAGDEEEKALPPDFPPESFWLSKDAEIDWFDRNAFLDRKESTKGMSSQYSTNLNHPSSHSNSNSQRFSSTLKAKSSIIGLPKTQKSTFIDSKRRTCKPANIRLFPAKRTESALKSVSTNEPSSPKVSCMGRVRSKRGRRRSTDQKSKKSSLDRSQSRSLSGSRRGGGDKRKIGFCSRVLSMFRSGTGDKTTRDFRAGEESMKKPARKSKSVKAAREVPVTAEPVHEPPAGLGGMNRFVSGRRSESWGVDEINAVISEATKVGPSGGRS